MLSYWMSEPRIGQLGKEKGENEMYLNGATKRESMYYAWTPTYDRKLRLRRVLGKRFRVINGNHTVECVKCRGTGNDYGYPISGCSKCNGDGYEIL